MKRQSSQESKKGGRQEGREAGMTKERKQKERGLEKA
jgi:hypothetical protein